MMSEVMSAEQQRGKGVKHLFQRNIQRSCTGLQARGSVTMTRRIDETV